MESTTSICRMRATNRISYFFFFNDTATTEIYTLSLHDALPISTRRTSSTSGGATAATITPAGPAPNTTRCSSPPRAPRRSEEHTSELQSRSDLVCRLLLEKKKTNDTPHPKNH